MGSEEEHDLVIHETGRISPTISDTAHPLCGTDTG